MSDMRGQHIETAAGEPEGPDAPAARQELIALSVVVREQSRVTREMSEANREHSAAVRRASGERTVQSSDLAHQVETLTRALQTRTEIATAMGLLMARQNITSDDAFAILRRASQRTNRKLHDIALDVLTVHNRRVGVVEVTGESA